VDLGVYDFSPALAELRRGDGSALLHFTDYWPLPETRRADLVLPLAGSPAPGAQRPATRNRNAAASTLGPGPGTLDSAEEAGA
jgi:hypothetical protein